MLNRLFILTTILYFFYGCQVLTKPDATVRGEIISQGIYVRNSFGNKVVAPNTAAGYIQASNAILIEETTKVKLRKGIGFGFEYKLHNLPDVEEIHIDVVSKHPEIINNDGKSFTESKDTWAIHPEEGVGEDHIIYWLTEPNEMVAGQWTLEVWYKNKLLVSQVFITY